MNPSIAPSAEAIESAAAFADSARDLLQAVSPLSRLRSLRTQMPRFDTRVWKQMAEAGWSAILVSERLGGMALGLRHVCAVAEQVGRNPVPEPFLGGAVHAVAVLAALPPSEQRDALLSAVAEGSALVGVAWQERAGQIDPADALTTLATAVDGVFELQGTKRWVVPGEGADGWLVSAWLDGTAGLWWVPAGCDGLRVVEEQRIDGSTCARVCLQATKVPKAQLLATGHVAMEALRVGADTTRLAQAAELLGIARQAFDITLDYLKTRVQFGKPIGSNQAVQHRAVDALLQIELAAACLEDVLSQCGEASPTHEAACRAKARCASAALHVTRLGVQLHGAIGFTDEHDLGLYLKRALHHSSWLGSTSAMRLRHHEQTYRPEIDGAGDVDGCVDSQEVLEGDWDLWSEDDFRRRVRAFLQESYPDAIRHPAHRLRWHECRDWYLTLSKQGWLAPAWPREHGGMGLPGDKLLAFIEEMEEYGVARLPDQGIINLGPILIGFGTPEQQQAYLPKILSGEHIWCQGYSEPNAGSDLASLRTEAIADGDDFIVNGQKIWTTLAQDATHIFTLVRTDRSVKKQAGISFLLIALATPGITVRPIRNIAGEEEFCEVFFDNVRTPRSNLVGGINNGWTIAKALLGFERIFVGSPKTAQYAMGLLRSVAQARGLFQRDAFVARYAELELDVADLKALYGRFAEMVKRHGQLPPSVSLLKIWASETYTAITRFLFEVCEEEGGAVGSIDFGGIDVNVAAPMMNAMVTTIYAGSNEIQRNILAKAVLELPG